MADNFTYKDASGTTRTGRSDDVAGVDYPGVKIFDGTAEGTTPLAISAEGALVRPGAPMRYATEVTVRVAPTASWADLVAANATRRALTLYNDGAYPVNVHFGANVGAGTVSRFVLAVGGFYEMPSSAIYTGVIAMQSNGGGTGSVTVAEAS